MKWEISISVTWENELFCPKYKPTSYHVVYLSILFSENLKIKCDIIKQIHPRKWSPHVRHVVYMDIIKLVLKSFYHPIFWEIIIYHMIFFISNHHCRLNFWSENTLNVLVMSDFFFFFKSQVNILVVNC